MTSKVKGSIVGQSSDYTRNRRMAYEAIMQKLTQYMKELAPLEERSACLADCKENKHEESIKWKDLWPAPPKLEDTLAEVQDPLLEVNLRAKKGNWSIYVSKLLPQE